MVLVSFISVKISSKVSNSSMGIFITGSMGEPYTLLWVQVFDLDPASCLLTSAKTGLGLEAVLPAVIERMPPPKVRQSER